MTSSYTFTQSSNVVWETNFNMYGTSNFNDARTRMYMWVNGETSIADNAAYSWYYLVATHDYGYYTSSDIGANTADIDWNSVIGSTPLPTPSSATDYNVLSQQILTSSGFTFNTIDFPSYTPLASYSQTGTNSNTFQLLLQSSDDGSSGNTNQLNVLWTRIRAYPPNGVMPSVNFGQI